MQGLKRRQALFFAGLLFFLSFFTLFFTVIRSIPAEMSLLPGEVGRLHVGFPFSLFAPEHARSWLGASAFQGSELVFNSRDTGKVQIELRLLGAVPLRRVAVNVVPERRVVLGGQAIGVLLAADGVVVVGHQPLKDLDGNRYYPARDAGIEAGDIILSADHVSIRHAEDLARLIGAAAMEKRPVTLEVRRAGRTFYRSLAPVVCDWPSVGEGHQTRAMLGLFVEDPAAGVGTMTFYNEKTGEFGALGHRITELGGQKQIWLQGGKIVSARISGVEHGQRGNPGEKIGTFSGPDDIIGTIAENTRFGLFGKLEDFHSNQPEISVSLAHQVHPGPAKIYTVVQGTEIQEFDVEIIRVYQQQMPHEKSMVVRVTDRRLLAMTGGIIQGMSGSPIVQDGRLAGAITHVFVNDPTRGYGVLAEWMLKEMDQLAAKRAA